MSWTITIDSKAEKEFSKLDNQIQKRITDFLREKISKNPKYYGKPLLGNKKGFYSYRLGDYRIIAEIIEMELLVLVLAFGHRKQVYKEK